MLLSGVLIVDATDRLGWLAGRVLVSGDPYVSSDYQNDVESAVMDDCQTALAVPMAWDNQMRGALSVGWNTRHRVHDEDLRTLEAIAGLATVACHNAEAYEQVQHVARTDALTGVLNHGAMQLRIREEIARARRDKAPLGAVILDLDDFKQVNDSLGHRAGDAVLREVAQRLALCVRKADTLARHGGDEFVVVISDVQADSDCKLVAEKVRELSIRLRDTSQPVRQLSGGNQQKVVLAKWLLVEGTKLYIFDEPTRGVDIATKVEIYQMIADLAARGAAVLLISSEMPEVLGLSDRLLILREGRLAAELAPEEFRPELVFAHAAGLALHPGPERLQ